MNTKVKLLLAALAINLSAIAGAHAADAAQKTFASPEVTIDEMLDRVADWITHDGPLLGKPTKFEARDGKF